MRKLNSATYQRVESVMDQLYARISSMEEIINQEKKVEVDQEKLNEAHQRLAETDTYFVNLSDQQRATFETIFENTKEEDLLKNDGWHAAYNAFLFTENIQVNVAKQNYLTQYDQREKVRKELNEAKKEERKILADFKHDNPDFKLQKFLDEYKKEKATLKKIKEANEFGKLKTEVDPLIAESIQYEKEFMQMGGKYLIDFQKNQSYDEQIAAAKKLYKELKDNKEAYQEMAQEVTEAYNHYQELKKEEADDQVLKDTEEEWKNKRDNYMEKVAPLMQLLVKVDSGNKYLSSPKKELVGFETKDVMLKSGRTINYNTLNIQWLKEFPKKVQKKTEYLNTKYNANEYKKAKAWKDSHSKWKSNYARIEEIVTQDYKNQEQQYKEQAKKVKQLSYTYKEVVAVKNAVNKARNAEAAWTDANKDYADNREGKVHEKIQNAADKILRKKALYQGNHKNSIEYDNMISAYEKAQTWPKDKEGQQSKFATREEALQHLKIQAENYLKAKNEQKRWFPSVMRRHRLKYAETILNSAIFDLDELGDVTKEQERVDKLEHSMENANGNAAQIPENELDAYQMINEEMEDELDSL